MGANGADIMLSTAARGKFPYSVECKNLAQSAAYGYYEQAKTGYTDLEPIVVLKINHRKPLVMVDAEHFFGMVSALEMYRRG